MLRERYSKQSINDKIAYIVVPLGLATISPLFIAMCHDVCGLVQGWQHDAIWMKRLMGNTFYQALMLLTCVITVIGAVMIFDEMFRQAKSTHRHVSLMQKFAGKHCAPVSFRMKFCLSAIYVFTAFALFLVFGPTAWVQAFIALF